MTLGRSLQASVAVLLPLQAASTFRALCMPFTYAYMDPIVTPGRLAGHLHHIAGTLGFSPEVINAAWMKNNVSTCDQNADHSNYWVPAMYRTDLPGGPQLMVPALDPYYEFTAPDVPFLNASVIAQPLSMILGKAIGPNATDDFNILFLARGSGPNNNRTETPSGRFGFHLDISDVKEYLIVYRFPSCWNGGSYKADQSHVAYPDRTTNRCPDAYPYQFPRLRIEQKYILEKPIAWSNGNAPFYFSSGAENTAHADAVLFWEQDTVQQLIETCTSKLAPDCPLGEKTSKKVRQVLATTYETPDKFLPRAGYLPPCPSSKSNPTVAPVI